MRRRTKNTSKKKKKKIGNPQTQQSKTYEPKIPVVVDHGAVGTSDVTNYHWRSVTSWRWCYCEFSGESTLRRCCPSCQHPHHALVFYYTSISSLYSYISLSAWDLGLGLASWVCKRGGLELGLWWHVSAAWVGGGAAWSIAKYVEALVFGVACKSLNPCTLDY